MTSITPTATLIKPKSRFGGGWFTPNAYVTNSTYRNIILIDITIMVGLWLLLPAIIPSPIQIITAFGNLMNDGLVSDLWASLSLNLEAIILSTFIALIISYGATIKIFRPYAEAISKARFLPLVGISFIMTLYTGGHTLKLALLTFGLTVFFVTSMIDVVLQVSEDTLDYVRTLRAGPWRVLWEAQIMGTLGTAFDILRGNAAMGWLMLTMVEGLVRSGGGIGTALLDQTKHFSLADIFAITFVFLLIGIGQDILIRWLKEIFAHSSTLTYSSKK